MIEVGDGKTHAKIFRAHMAILNYRSPYLREILFENKWKNYDGTLVRIELPNILPEIFQVILRYIYGGKLTLKNYDNLYIIKLLIAANELSIKELTIFESYSFLELQNYCNNLMSKNPNKIFESLDFPSIPEKIFISIIQNDNLQMDVVQIWKNVLKWGLAQNPELSSEPLSYSKDDFNNLRNTLEQCIPFIKFYDLTSKEFSDNILPYRKIIPEELYLDLLQSFLNLHPDSKLNISKPHMVKEINPSQHNINKSIEIFNPAPFSRTNKRRVRRYRQRLKKIFSQIDSENCSRGFGRGFGRGRGRGGRFGRGRDEGDEGEICFRGGYGRGRDEGEVLI
uniref:BTB domain-containing protein n=1 Tax=Rhizophagus irregularis (strain DAOM 181602 / DAOM 197198 / MUCL 43194) TaxID=747089 RepID=U9UUL9_RHIID